MDENWRLLAKCRGRGRIFYSEELKDTIIAKSLCKICPVQKPCLAEALVTLEPYGIRGGLTAKERFKITSKWDVQNLLHNLPTGTAHVAESYG